jgi:DNA-binding transcriptional LysR family regulator
MKLLLTEGVGWGYMPEPLVNKDIERGQLVVLSGDLRRSCVLHALYRKDTPLGPAASFFVARLVSQASSEVHRGPAECGVSRLAGKA